jgi:hypothetical protein
MEKSFFEAIGLIFKIPIPFEEIKKVADSKIIAKGNRKLVYFKSYDDLYFPIEYETQAEDSFLFKKKKYFIKSIFIENEFNHFEREAMFQFVYSLIENKEYIFNIVTGGFLAEEDNNLYNFLDIKNNVQLD